MLIQFKIANFRSVAKEQVISLVPAPKQREFPGNVIENAGLNVLNALAFYGPNGSGKSNLLKAMGLLDRLVNMSMRNSSTAKLPYDPFLLQEGWEGRPTSLEISFILNSSRYRYGLTYNESEIITEWLFRKNTGREVVLFERDKDLIETSSGLQGSLKLIDAAIEATRPNSLFLSTCDMLNVEEAKQIMRWFQIFTFVDGLKTEEKSIQTIELWKNPLYQQKIKEFICKLNFSILDIDISTQKMESSALITHHYQDFLNGLVKAGEQDMEITSVFAQHKNYNAKGEAIGTMNWRLHDRESAGIQKAFELSGPLLWTLINGGTLVVDELEAKMHPVMTLNTIDLFLHKSTNPNSAQIVFATHDTNLLSYCNLRRDQIYFVDRNKVEATEIYSLSDFTYLQNKDSDAKGIKERPDADKEKRYFEGRYGAIPHPKTQHDLNIPVHGQKR